MVSAPRQEYDFALIVEGVPELNQEVEDALFGAGCDDATLSMQYGRLYAEFSRAAVSLEDAVTSAVRAVESALTGARVLKVDDCNLVTASDIARRLSRSRQLVHQYVTGQRGPGDFPAPEYHLSNRAPLWTWSSVSRWLLRNSLIREEEARNAEVLDAINRALDARRDSNPDLERRIAELLQSRP